MTIPSVYETVVANLRKYSETLTNSDPAKHALVSAAADIIDQFLTELQSSRATIDGLRVALDISEGETRIANAVADGLRAERDEAQLQQKAWADKWDHAISRAEAAEASLTTARTDGIEVERLREAAMNLMPYLVWQLSDESPGYHPTMRSAIGAFEEVFFPNGYKAARQERLRALSPPANEPAKDETEVKG